MRVGVKAERFWGPRFVMKSACGRWVLVALACLSLTGGGLGSIATAQRKTQGELDLDSEIRDMRDRRDAAARMQNSLDDNAANLARQRADETKRLRELTPGESAAEQARQQALYSERAAARVAEENAYQQREMARLDATREIVYGRQIGAYVRVLMKAGDYEGALRVIDRFLQRTPNDQGLWEMKADAERLLKRYPEAITDIYQARSREGYNGYGARYVEGMIRMDMGQYELAQEQFDIMVKQLPDSYDGRFGRGLLKYKMGDYAGAVADLRVALKEYPNELEALDGFALANAKLTGTPAPADVTARLEGRSSGPPLPPLPTINACDRIGASPIDDTRPPILDGVDNRVLDIKAVISTCSAQVQAEPTDARAKFNLARGLVMAERCDEGVDMLKQAVAKGSGAAAYAYSKLSVTKCAALGPSDKIAALDKAVTLHNAAAAKDMGDYYNQLWLVAYQAKQPEEASLYKKMKEYQDIAIDVYGAQAKAGGRRGIEVMAEYANNATIQSGALDLIFRCKARSYESCKDY